MGITLVIVGGLVLVSVVAGGFDYLSKRNAGAAGGAAGRAGLERRLGELEARQAALEREVRDRDEEIAKLRSDLSFVNRLLEDKSGK